MRRANHPQIELQIAPMIDVCFLLLFFYILTSKPVKPEADVSMTLPGTVSQEESLEIPDEQRITILEDGQVVLNDLPMDEPQSRDLPSLLKTLVRFKEAADANKSEAPRHRRCCQRLSPSTDRRCPQRVCPSRYPRSHLRGIRGGRVMSATVASASEIFRKQQRKRIIITVILASIGIHVIAGVVAGIVIVARFLTEPPAEFKVIKDIRIPVQDREHKMNMAAFDGMAPKPSFTDKLQSLRPGPLALPELPKVPMDQLLPLDPAEILADQVAALAGTDGAGSGVAPGAAGSGGAAGIESGFSFMGIESTGKRVLLIFDVSASVLNKARKRGISLEKIKEETIALLEQLPINARFGIIQFTQNFKAFREELLAATDANRATAKAWIEDEWVATGSMQASAKVTRNPRGVVGVFELAVRMLPDVIFLISDASFQWKEGGRAWRCSLERDRENRQGPLAGDRGLRAELRRLRDEAR